MPGMAAVFSCDARSPVIVMFHVRPIDAGGRRRRKPYFDRRDPAIAGRADDFIVSMRVGPVSAHVAA